VYANLVKLYPRWLHPNVITVMGFFSALMASVTVLKSSPDLKSEADAECYWAYFIMSLGLTLYMIFDNTDGKQARRIGASSHIGETLDHGVDMAVTTMQIVAISDCLGFGNAPVMVITTMVVLTSGMYINNWNHLITGKMSFGGRFFSVDEGMIAGAMIPLLRFCYGASFYNHVLFSVPKAGVAGNILSHVGFVFQNGDLDGADSFPIKMPTLVLLASGGPAIYDVAVKTFFGLKHAVASNQLQMAVTSLLWHAAFIACIFLRYNQGSSEDFAANHGLVKFCFLYGSLFALLGCAVVMGKTLTPSARFEQQLWTMLLFCMCAYTIKEKEHVEWCSYVGPCVYLISFSRSLVDINVSKGWQPFFTVKSRAATN
jgi:phosphatidylglycerophosphate synthase